MPRLIELCPADKEDIVDGNGKIIWYPDRKGRKWCRIDTILQYGTYNIADRMYKAHDNLNYGIEGAFMEVKDIKNWTDYLCKAHFT